MGSGTSAEEDWKILHATARRHFWHGEGWLSIKSFSGGRAQYSVGCGHHAVDDECYLVLNHGRTYTIDIDSRQPIESFCIFFGPHFAADVLKGHSQTNRALLDVEHEHERGNNVEFFEKTYSHDEIVSPLLHRLRHAHRECEPGAVEENLHHLLSALLRAHNVALRETESLQSVRPATRHELYRRVARARDFADAMFAEPITLKQIARAAALSPNHLLRAFSQVYRQTPHQFLTARRLREAAHLLARTELPVTDICMTIGFSSLGSFSSLFKRRFGVSPAQFRRAKK